MPSYMIKEFVEQYREATISVAQTTYLTLQVPGQLCRIDYVHKREFQLRKGVHGLLSWYTEHPLLLDYNAPRATLYANSWGGKPRASDPQALAEEIRKAVASASHNWRHLSSYVYGWDTAKALAFVQQNLADGSGILLSDAPAPLVKAALAVCEKYGATTYCSGSLESRTNPASSSFSVLFIGSCYVIAQDFHPHAL